MPPPSPLFYNTPPTTLISTLSLHDALPILVTLVISVIKDVIINGSVPGPLNLGFHLFLAAASVSALLIRGRRYQERSEEHTSELQSQFHLVCRLLLEKKNSTGRTKDS